jgi:hypothetical protein
LVDAGRTLLVSFESVAGIRKHNDDAAPLGCGFVQSHGWSSLTVMANAELDWFRHPAVYGYFDRMIDDGFFDDFDQILFYGRARLPMLRLHFLSRHLKRGFWLSNRKPRSTRPAPAGIDASQRHAASISRRVLALPR